MHMELTYGGELAESAGLASAPTVADVAQNGEQSDLHMTMSASGVDMEIIAVGGEFYLGMGELTQGKFVHMSGDEAAQDPNFASMLAGLKTIDFAAQAEGFASAITAFEKTGTDVVNGTDVTVYTMTVDPATLTGEASLVDPSVASQIGAMTVVYALDAQNVPLKSDITMDVAGQAMTISTVISKVNEPVTIAAPPADQTIPYADMMAGAGS
jgi:hypothetical protein